MATQNLGTLYVRLNAQSQDFVKGMASAAERVEKFAKETKKLANEVAGVSATLLAIGGAAVKLAASVDGKAAKSMERLERNSKLLAVQVADVLRPAVDSLAATFKQAAEWVAGLDPALKKQAATWAIYIAQLAVAAKVIGTVAGLIDQTAGAFGALFKAIGAVGLGPILGIVAAIAAVVALVIFLHRAWRKNWGGIQQVTEDVFKNLGDAVKWLADLFSKMWNHIIDGAEGAVNALLTVAEKIAALAGQSLDTSGLREGLAGMFKDLRSGSFFTDALKFAKSVATDLGDAVKEEVALIKKEVMDALNLSSISKPGATARAPTPLGPAVKRPFVTGAYQPDYTDGRAINAGGEYLAAMNRELKANQRAMDEEAKARKLARDALYAEATAREHAIRMANAKETGNLAGLTREEKKRVRADESEKTWGELGKAQQTIQNFARRMGGMVTSAMGALGSTISAIADGAKAGGPWGAAIAAIMEVFKRMESFQHMLSILEYGLKRLGEFMEPLFGPLFKFIEKATAMGTEILKPLFDAFVPIFEAIADALNDTLPFMVLLGMLFKAVAPIIKALAKILGTVIKILSPVLRFLFEIARVVLLVILTLIDGILAVWNGIIDTIADIVKFVVDIFTAGQGGDAVAAEIRKAKADRLTSDIEELKALTFDQTQAVVENTSATWDAAAANTEAAKAAQSVAESMSNVPSGYKMALTRYRASDSESPYSAALAGTSVGGGASGGSTTVINGDVNVTSSAETIEEIADDAKKEAARERGQRTGSTRPPRMAGGDW